MGYYDVLGYDEVELLGEGEGEDVELLGEDVELLGAAPSPAARRAIQQRAAQRGVIVRKKPATGSRDLILPCTAPAATAAGATTVITVQPSQPFRAKAFIVDNVIAPNFQINSIQVGRQNQFVGAGSVPATAFVPNSPLANIGFDTGQTSEQIQVSVTNISAAASTFAAMFVGKTID